MVDRNLQKQPHGSYTISVPISWVRKRRLEAQDSIRILTERDGSLRVFPVDKPIIDNYTVTLKLENYSDLEALDYTVRTYYMQGVNQINIVSRNRMSADTRTTIKDFCSELIGLQVAKESPNELVFEVFSKTSIPTAESLLRKSLALNKEIHANAIKSLLENDIKLATETIESAMDAVRRYRATIRHLSLSSQNKTYSLRTKIRDCQECVTFALTARDIDRLAYHSVSIAKELVALRGKKIETDILDKISRLSAIVLQMENDAVNAFLEGNTRLAVSTMRRMRKVRMLDEQLLMQTVENMKDVKVALAIHDITRSLRKIAGHSIAIADSAMNRTLCPTT